MPTNINIWRTLYRSDIPQEQTGLECDLIAQLLPLPSHPRLLDLACGAGRHSLEMARRGYVVTAVDMDAHALEVARADAEESGLSLSFIEADLRELKGLLPPFDGIILFWQSFGFFDVAAQTGIFAQFRRLLRPGGRLILDLYNRLHFTRGFESHGIPRTEEPALLPSWGQPSHLEAPLGYEEDLRFQSRRRTDLFDPHMFTPGEVAGIAANHGLSLIVSCSGFSTHLPATAEHPRMQLVFEATSPF